MTMPTGSPLSSAINLMAIVFDEKTKPDFLWTMMAATRKIGFDRFLVDAHWYDQKGALVHQIASNYPVEWPRICAERECIVPDPTIVHCRTSTDALAWTTHLFENTDALDFPEHTTSQGVEFCFSVPVCEARGGVKSMIRLVRDKPLTAEIGETELLIAAGKVLASCAYFSYLGPSKLIVVRGSPRMSNGRFAMEETRMSLPLGNRSRWPIGSFQQACQSSTPAEGRLSAAEVYPHVQGLRDAYR
ncbi:autoinducer binding domain-containing protein [Xylophilus ampelinus]|uniref:Autoinducer binding domain-containing protein n=1 Tax=Xylophilus ampelinus TaxID=54067 RepID=A0A318SF80_9BURK|nr:autoinducer binding domain-containing protein [Xylophilus ampelinus]MCS4510896.1 autoinducer binding domain-containing protein [Xylophilus ampelinus]PYE76055.1 autoinducer binding domain-containing protein [Xylophilus ampelinus]